ncbi:TPA: PilI type IV pilus biogenesis protein, partial [Escherichia coli]|nr:PilI type IV pilus biogenesis protein [Escherichia coli]EII4814692.1 PilI type IV pilus biogenesis protein [Escherichia coli]EIX4181634.1 PilI type IV pilus biogenesis protein [Escherichia coli]EJD1154740.1 PilI type IV pilus biogenesis protein [Escherichia coli]EKD2727858.1 PilI type IV pilus biogenesis protein [Escherichia coli]
LIIVCQNTRIIRRTERIPGSCSEWKEVALPLKARSRIKL